VTTAPDADSPLRRALSALERSRIRLEAVERERSEPIAIIGAGCRLPGGVGDLDSYWALLERGGDAVTAMPQARWNTTSRHDPDRTAPATPRVPRSRRCAPTPAGRPREPAIGT